MTGFFSSLRFRLLLLVLLALMPALGLILYTASEQRQRAVTEVEANAMRLTRLVAADHESYIQGARTLLITLARLPEVRGEDRVACSALCADLLRQYPHYTNLAAAQLNGDVFCSGLPLTGMSNVAYRSYFQRAIESRDFALGEYQIGSVTGKATIGFGYPVLDDTGNIQAVVLAYLDLAWLNRFMTEARLPVGSTLRVIDRNGTILARYPDPEKWVGRSVPEATIIKAILSQREGVADAPGVDGVPRLYAFMPLNAGASGDVYVSIGIPKEIAFAEADWILARNLVALGMVAVLALAAAWLGGDLFIFRQVDALLTVTKRLAAGDLSARTGLRYGVGEISQLSRTFDQMAETLEQRESERKQTEEQIRRQAARAESLVRVASRLNAQLDLESVLNALCEETVHALNVPAACISLYDPNRDVLYHATDCGLPPESRELCQPVLRDVHDQYARQMGPITVIPDILDSPDLPNADLYAALNIRTIVGASMLREGQLVGILNIFTRGETHRFTADELMLLKGLADQAAQAIANARLYVRVEEEGRARANLLHKIITAQEDERNRIARELHDRTAQGLTLLMMDLDLGRKAEAIDIQTADRHFQRSRSIAEETLGDLRRIVADLRPSLLDDLGLVPAIAWYGEQRLKPLGITLQLRGNALERRLPQVMETAIFRIAQEALANTAKHSGASRVIVSLEALDGHLVIEVRDDGKGFQVPATEMAQANGDGLGLPGIKERATLLGGEFSLQTAPGQGTVITVRVPLREEVQDV